MSKQRLIDADALKENMFHYAAPEMMWDRGDIEHKINEMPTIDAIPVEWLREKMNIADDAGDLDSVDLFSWILQTWQKEQEAKT